MTPPRPSDIYTLCGRIDISENLTEPSAFFLAEKTYNKDLEIPPCRLHPNFCFAKTSLNPDVNCNSKTCLSR